MTCAKNRRLSTFCLITMAVLTSLVLGASALAQESVVPITTTSTEARDLFVKARDLFDNAHVAEGRKLLEDAIAKDPGFVMALYYLSMVETNTDKAKQRLDEAAAQLDKAKVSDGERLWVQIAQAGWKSDPNKQRELLESLVKAYPKDKWAHLSLGGHYSALQDHDRAAAEFKKATELAPEFGPAFNSMGYASRNKGDLAEAEKAFKRYTELQPNEPNPWDSYAELLMKEGKFDESIASYQKALDLDSKFYSSFAGQGLDKALNGKVAEGRKLIQHLFEVAPDDGWRGQAQNVMASSYLLERKFDQAIQEEKKALAMFGKSKDYAAMAGVTGTISAILFQQGKTRESKAQMQKSLDLVGKSNLPDETKAKNKMWLSVFGEARLAIVAKDLKTAKQKADEFKAFAEKDQIPGELQASHFLAGLIALQEKRFDDAASELAQANPRSVEAMVILGDAYLAKGDKDKAREMWTKAANFNEIDIEFAMMKPLAQQKLSKLK